VKACLPSVVLICATTVRLYVLCLGGDALALLRSHCCRDSMDGNVQYVMLLDVGIPTLSGLQVVQQCPKPLPFPIIAMTGTVDVESVEQYRYIGFAMLSLVFLSTAVMLVSSLQNCGIFGVPRKTI
jgi:CheY-like chemotaxis protein